MFIIVGLQSQLARIMLAEWRLARFSSFESLSWAHSVVCLENGWSNWARQWSGATGLDQIEQLEQQGSL